MKGKHMRHKNFGFSRCANCRRRIQGGWACDPCTKMQEAYMEAEAHHTRVMLDIQNSDSARVRRDDDVR